MDAVRQALTLALLLGSVATGETRRALIIGINEYAPPAGESAVEIRADSRAGALVPDRPPRTRASFRNLHGAVNDAREVRRVLVERFGFADADVRMLEDRAATREAILRTIPEQLAPAAARKGDVALLYFAGHGSQVLNSKSRDHLDESLVPSDSWRGVPDIRNKEIARLLNAMVDRGLIVTFIADSCHSGSIARGAHPAGSRLLEYDPRDANDAGYTGPSPQERGALIVSSTQSNQEAKETTDGSHGLFTWAFARVLSASAPGAPVGQVFQQTRALLQSEVSWQEPVIAGGAGRIRASLIGLPSEAGDYMAMRGVASGGKLLLEGAMAATLNPDCELERRGSPAVRVRVTRVVNLTAVEAEVVAGPSASVARGDLFELARWVVPENDALRVLVQPKRPPRAEIERVAKALEPLRGELAWIDDPTAAGAAPTHVLRWDREWVLETAGGRSGIRPDAASIRARIGGTKARLLVDLPLPSEFEPPAEGAVRVVESDAARPHYALAGSWREGRLEYAWIAPDATEDVASRMSLPARTDWVTLDHVTRLKEYTVRIAKLRAWLALASPPASSFPYTLALRNVQNGDERVGGATVTEDEEYRLTLKADIAELRKLEDDGRLSPRFVYVFSIDRQGRSTLLFPPLSAGNDGNRLPKIDEGSGPAPARIELGGPNDTLRIAEPFGVDTYVLLATQTAIPNPGVLEFDGVETKAVRRGAADPLEDLLAGLGTGRRRGPAAAPAKWTVTRYSFRSVAKRR